MIAPDKLDQIIARFQFLEAKMSAGVSGAEIATLSREYSELKPVVDTVTGYRRLVDDIAEAEAMLRDPEMQALAEEELPDLREQLEAAEQAVRLALLPKDAADGRPALIEIRPGTGG
ncbi:MAG: PCRF domain-containing protein, partial [Rhodobacteraceae bacterium]|nr:PCRF domain-containing protein [Paracoccaceae bacterium]